MPYSTGSDDSGVNFHCVEYSNSCCFDLSAPTSSLTCSEDEHSYHSAIPLLSKPLSRSQRGGKARNKKRKQAAVKQKQLKQRPASQPNSLSTESTCGSEDSGLLLEEFGYSDVVQVYFYFQQLAAALREQQKSFQQMARVMGDIDARWGASGYKNGWKLDPTGSMAPAPSEGFWSYPHPAVYLALMANYIQKYLYFLRRVYPQVGVLSHGSVQNIPRLYFGGGGRGEDLPELFPPPPRNHNQHNRQHQQQRVGGEHKHHGDDMARLMQMMQQQHKVLAQQQLHHQSPPLPQPQFRGGGIHSNNHHQHSTSSGNRTPPPPPANLATWPVPGYPTDGSKSEPTLVVKSPVLQQSSPLKQNYSAVVARNSRSSEGGSTPAVVVIGQKAVSEGGSPMVTTPTTPQPLLYSQKAALSLQQTPRKLRLETKTPVKKEHEENGETPSSLVPSPAAPVSPDHDKIDLPLSPPNAQPSPPPREPVDQSGQFEISKMDVLSEQIWHFHNQVTQKDSTLTKKLSLRDMLYYAISPVFPMCGLYVVGSSLNGFGNDKSDMDLCLMITNKDLDQKTDAVVVLNMISSTLQKMDWVKTQKLILAKVPILRIKFAAPFDDITVDLNANNSVAIKNTHLLCYYSSFDWRVRPLVSIVKEWAKKKGINDANRSSFTSYSLVLMVIHYLQCGVQPPILPSLQHKYPKRFSQRADVRMLSVTQPLIIESEWTYHDKATLGELLIGFLKYFSSKFDYNAQAISVREGKLISRTQVTRSRGHTASQSVTWRSQWRCICIEEPFTLNNTAHSIYDEMVFNAIKLAFEEAHDELDKTRDIHRLLECTPITVAPPVHGATAYVYNGMGGDSPQ